MFVRTLLAGALCTLLAPAIPAAAEESPSHAKIVEELRSGGVKVIVDEKQPDKPVVEVRVNTQARSHRFVFEKLRGLKDFTILKVWPPLSDNDMVLINALTNVRELTLHGDEINDAMIRKLDPALPLTSLCIESDNSQKKTITDLSAAHLAKFKSLESLDIHGAFGVTDNGVRLFASLPNLKRLRVSSIPIRDKAIETFRGHKSLRSLDVSGTWITSAGLAVLRDVPELRELKMPIDMGGNMLAPLEQCVRLESLDASHARCKDNDLLAIARLPNLQKLTLDESLVTDAGIAHLKTLTALRELHLFRTPITDKGVEEIATLANLEVLTLDSEKITDASLLKLQALRKLRWLRLRRAKVTLEGILAAPEMLKRLAILELYQVKVQFEDVKKRYPHLRAYDKPLHDDS